MIRQNSQKLDKFGQHAVLAVCLSTCLSSVYVSVGPSVQYWYLYMCKSKGWNYFRLLLMAVIQIPLLWMTQTNVILYLKSHVWSRLSITLMERLKSLLWIVASNTTRSDVFVRGVHLSKSCHGTTSWIAMVTKVHICINTKCTSSNRWWTFDLLVLILVSSPFWRVGGKVK